MIEADKQTLKEMGLSGKMAELEKELQLRFEGNKNSDEGTSQLITVAMTIPQSEYSKYM